MDFICLLALCLFALSLSLPSPAAASQPGAPAPAPAPLRSLHWGQLNFLHTTDTHGWLAGHLQEYALCLVVSGSLNPADRDVDRPTPRTGVTMSLSQPACGRRPSDTARICW
jgi:2',3'-cyclic-nucleotide 2'-phosphodiesterase (5'-nucleotidase family)